MQYYTVLPHLFIMLRDVFSELNVKEQETLYCFPNNFNSR